MVNESQYDLNSVSFLCKWSKFCNSKLFKIQTV